LELAVPIRFACDHCGGVLSIARRKAYALVECPKCGCKQVVPSENRGEPAAKEKIANGHADASTAVPVAGAEKPAAERPLFERKDIEALLANSAKSVPAPAAAVADAILGVELVAEGGDVLLRRSQLVPALVLAVLAALFVFGLGFLVGRYA
jgi:phage FluMu protein Com